MTCTTGRLMLTGFIATSKWWSGLACMVGGVTVSMGAESYSHLVPHNPFFELLIGCGAAAYGLLRLLMAMRTADCQRDRFGMYCKYMVVMCLAVFSMHYYTVNFEPEQYLVMIVVGLLILGASLAVLVLRLYTLFLDARHFKDVTSFHTVPYLNRLMWYAMCEYKSLVSPKKRRAFAKRTAYQLMSAGLPDATTILTLNRLLGTNLQLHGDHADGNGYNVKVTPGEWHHIPVKDE